MLSLAIAAIVFNALCLAGLYLFARRDVVLVDEHGHMVSRGGPWRERRIPVTHPEEEAPV